MRQKSLMVLVIAFLGIAGSGAIASETVSSQTYEVLEQVQDLMGEDRNDKAYEELVSLSEEVDPDTLDEAVVLQMLGRLELNRDDYSSAIDAFRKSHDLGKLPEDMQSEVGRILAQLYASEERYEEALGFARTWLDEMEKPKPSQLIFMANVLAQTERLNEAIDYANEAIELSDDPRESWFQLVVSASYRMQDYSRAAEDLKRIIRRWPDEPQYWQQLANVHVELDDRETALAVLQLAWKSGVLEREDSVHSMIQLAINRGIPERGARLLEHAFEKGALPEEIDYVRLLANAWIASREYSSGVAVLERLAELEGTGGAYLRIANLQIDRGQWQDAEAAIRRAREYGLSEPGEAWVLLGIALTEQDEFEEGMAALRKGRAFEESKKRARRWLKYARQLQKQYNWKSRNQSQGA